MKRAASKVSTTPSVPSNQAIMDLLSSPSRPPALHNLSETPPGKRQKVEGRNLPITFTSPNKGPDTCIVIFDQEFHVHSEALVLHAVYFQRFMQPVNASATRRGNPGAWKYEWFTKVEDPTSWVLSSAPEDRDSNTSTYTNPEIQVKGFENLLRALFGRQAKLSDAADLVCLTDLADYYLCLPIVSNACYETLFDNPKLNASITSNAAMLLPTACKLRHKILFRECLIHTVGNLSIIPKKEDIPNPKLLEAILAVRNKCKATLYSVGKEILEMQLDPATYGGKNDDEPDIQDWVISNTRGCLVKTTEGKVRVFLPMYYRKLWSINHPWEITQAAFKRLLDPIMKSNLKLDTSGLGSGEGKYRNHFLFIHIEDSELPWESSQTDF